MTLKLLAITTFPPSQEPLSSFGFQAVKQFLSCKEIGQIQVLADIVASPELPLVDGRLVIQRCWRVNSILNIFKIVSHVVKYAPDVVWMNLQYNLFGPKLVPAFLGLLIPACIRYLKFKTVLLLHNYYAAIDLDKLGMPDSRSLALLMKAVDPIILNSISTVNQVLVMREDYQLDLSIRCPQMRVKYIEQDLYDVFPFCPVDPQTKNILTFGVFGTYKKLEILLDAFQLLRKTLPAAILMIAGKAHPTMPRYLDNLFHLRSHQLANVVFLGYVSHEDLPAVFRSANIVVLTSSFVPGSPSVIRYAAAYGRGVVLPDIGDYQGLANDGWGVKQYKFGDTDSLCCTILDVLTNLDMQLSLAVANHNKASRFKNQFIKAHLEAFFVGKSNFNN